MAKLVYVPDWLRSHLAESNQPVTKLSATDVSASIVSKLDVINYFKAQFEFFKLLALNTDPMNVGKYSPQDVAYHEYVLPEVQLYLRSASKDTVDWSVLSSCTTDPRQLDFDVEADPDAQIVYIIERGVAPGHDPSWVTDGKRSLVNAILCKALQHAHAHIRVEHQYTDKATVLRENPTIAQFYVKSLLV